MDSHIDSVKEETFKSLLGQLEVECGILERIVYKNKNQHRRSSYFQYVLKVRRDLRLLKSANLEELLSSCFLVITGKRPKQTLNLLESLKRRKYDVGKPNFMERLLGAARLLSQILLDIVSVFNTVCSLSRKKHFVKITHEGIEVYREFYPKKEDRVTLECVWNTDKFVLVEKMNKCEIEMEEGDNGGKVSVIDNTVRYKTIESFLGDEPTIENADAEKLPHMKDSATDLIADPLTEDKDRKQVENFDEKLDTADITETPGLRNVSQAPLLADTGTSASSDSLKVISNTRKVAFISVKRPASSTANPTVLPSKAATSTMHPTDLRSKETGSNEGDKTDAFYSLLIRGNLKDSLFG